MRRKLTVRPQAEIDLLGHYFYFLERQPALAERFKKAVRTAFDALPSKPQSFAVLDRAVLPDLELRFSKPAGFSKHLVVFQVTDDSVVVLRVLHSSQDIDAALRP
jgi:plasmid stabilization system protein ParE